MIGWVGAVGKGCRAERLVGRNDGGGRGVRAPKLRDREGRPYGVGLGVQAELGGDVIEHVGEGGGDSVAGGGLWSAVSVVQADGGP